MSQTTFLQDFFQYVGRMRLFNNADWKVYLTWVGLMLGLLGSVLGFLLFGAFNGVSFPAYVWNIPIGTGIFVLAIAIDSIGHRSIYKEELAKAEALVHHITIFCGITSIVCLVAAYTYREFFRFPAIVLTLLAIFYSMVDEWMHWSRYQRQKSDRVEMWSHLFIFVGHFLMSVSWYWWFEMGYPGVEQTLQLYANL